MLDNCRVWLNLAIGLVYPAADMESKGMCAYTRVKKRQESFEVKKVQNLRLGRELSNFFKNLFEKWRGPKNANDNFSKGSYILIVLQLLFIITYTNALEYMSVTIKPRMFWIMNEITKIQLLVLAYVLSSMFRIKLRVNNWSVVFLLVITLELFVYMCCPPLSFPALYILLLVFSHLEKELFMIRQDI